MIAASSAKSIEGLSTPLLAQVRSAQAELFGVQRFQCSGVLAHLRTNLEAELPPNWRGASPDIDAVDSMLLDEGLCLAWTPPRELLGRMFDAPSSQARRAPVGASWLTIADNAMHQLDDVRHDDLAGYREFGLSAAEALTAGHHDAAQALTSNLLETILQPEFEEDARRHITARRENEQPGRLDLDDFTLRVGVVFGGIWGSYAQYQPGTGGSGIPRQFSRHASTHAVGPRSLTTETSR